MIEIISFNDFDIIFLRPFFLARYQKSNIANIFLLIKMCEKSFHSVDEIVLRLNVF